MGGKKRSRTDVDAHEPSVDANALSSLTGNEASQDKVNGKELLPNNTLNSAVGELLKDALRHEKMKAEKVKGDGEAFDVPDGNVFIQFTFKIPPSKDKVRPISMYVDPSVLLFM